LVALVDAVLPRTVGGGPTEPIGELRVGAELLHETGDLVTTFTAALVALNDKRCELAEQVAEYE
jgi:hypothetical protein